MFLTAKRVRRDCGAEGLGSAGPAGVGGWDRVSGRRKAPRERADSHGGGVDRRGSLRTPIVLRGELGDLGRALGLRLIGWRLWGCGRVDSS